MQAIEEKEKLLRHDDRNLKDRATKFKEFLDCNNEKVTKAFCKLSKEGGLCDDMTQICGDDEKPFVTDEDRQKHVRKFYEKLYKRKLDRLLRVEDFLTNETIDQDWVRRRRLTEEEKMELEGEVTLEELTESLEDSNFHSSSGWDGISYKVIRKYWGLLGPIMKVMTNEVVETGELIETFKLGLIKLIPKKGNAKKVGDWRPITLLVCGYKILSGVVAARLEKHLMKIIGRAQKGFLKRKHIHACTVNIATCISESWAANEEMGVMCVDFAKAFDSVEHEAISNTLRFFNFGEIMIKMVRTILYDRKSRIIVDSGYTDSIPIERGTPQGDRSSPFIFIICMEILLIKITSLNGRGIDCCDFIRRRLEGIDIETVTAEAYADDLTIIFKMAERGVEVIKETLVEYGRVMGLEINIEKTQLMITGSDARDGLESVAGIKVVSKIKILGFELDRKLLNLDGNWVRIIANMRKICRYWATFRLSITGRIAVAKTYILSQAIYFMGTLPLSDEMGGQMNDIILDFISGGGQRIERSRWFASPEKGGYGMFDINELNMCIKASWLGRWKRNLENKDYYGLVLAPDGVEKAEEIDTDRIMEEGGIVLSDIAQNWEKYKKAYYKEGNAVLEAVIRGNKTLGREGKTLWELVLGRRRYGAMMGNVGEIKLGDILSEDGNLRDKMYIERILGANLQWAEYFRMRDEVTRVVRTFGAVWGGENFGMNLDEFVSMNKKGCRRYRLALSGKRSKKYVGYDPRGIRSAVTLWGNDLLTMGKELTEVNFKIWSLGSLEANFKEFCFKLVHGKLYLNAQRARFDRETNRWCTFCGISKISDLRRRGIFENNPQFGDELRRLPAEDPVHLFWGCNMVQTVVQRLLNHMADTGDRIYSQKNYMGGKQLITKEGTMMVVLIVHYVKFRIFVCRLTRKIPLFHPILEHVQDLLGQIRKIPKWRNHVLNLRDCLRLLD
jgi:hypothetical protein